MFKSTGLAKMFAGHRKFFRGPHVRHLCSRPMRCFAKFYSWDCSVKLHYEVIISTDLISLVNILDRSLRYVISLDQNLCL